MHLIAQCDYSVVKGTSILIHFFSDYTYHDYLLLGGFKYQSFLFTNYKSLQKE